MFEDYKLIGIRAFCDTAGILMTNVFQWCLIQFGLRRAGKPCLALLNRLLNLKLDFTFPVLVPTTGRSQQSPYHQSHFFLAHLQYLTELGIFDLVVVIIVVLGRFLLILFVCLALLTHEKSEIHLPLENVFDDILSVGDSALNILDLEPLDGIWLVEVFEVIHVLILIEGQTDDCQYMKGPVMFQEHSAPDRGALCASNVSIVRYYRS